MPLKKQDLEGFPVPSFLPEEVLTKRLAWNVVSMEDLPERLKKEFPDGFVIKRYLDMYSDSDEGLALEAWSDDASIARHLRFSDEAQFRKKFQKEPTDDELEQYLRESYDTSTLADHLRIGANNSIKERIAYLRNMLKPEAIAARLMKDQDLLIDFFHKDLPHFVERMDFVLGQPDPAGPRYVYGIQKQIKEYIPLVDDEDMDMDITRGMDDKLQKEAERTKKKIVSRFSPEALSAIIDQLSVFIEKVRELGFVPYRKVCDIWGPNNIVITADGTLKLIDIDILTDFYRETSLNLNRFLNARQYFAYLRFLLKKGLRS